MKKKLNIISRVRKKRDSAYKGVKINGTLDQTSFLWTKTSVLHFSWTVSAAIINPSLHFINFHFFAVMCSITYVCAKATD